MRARGPKTEPNLRCPDCDHTRNPEDDRTFNEGGWLHTEHEGRSLDFCSHKCMGEWALAQPGNTTTVVDGR